MAWVLATQSSLAYWHLLPVQSVELAAKGLEISSGPFVGRLHGLSARAWAQLGDAAAARTALSRARPGVKGFGAGELEGVGGMLSFPQALLDFFACSTCLWLGDARAAERHARAAILARDANGCPVLGICDLALARVELARSQLLPPILSVGDARDALHPLLALAPREPVARLGPALAALLPILNRPGMHESPEARALRVLIGERVQGSGTGGM
jgi:hypothetical protein